MDYHQYGWMRIGLHEIGWKCRDCARHGAYLGDMCREKLHALDESADLVSEFETAENDEDDVSVVSTGSLATHKRQTNTSYMLILAAALVALVVISPDVKQGGRTHVQGGRTLDWGSH